jgi:hypothetical protein
MSQIVPAQLRARLGSEASEGLVEMFAAYQEFSTDRYERRLAALTAVLPYMLRGH